MVNNFAQFDWNQTRAFLAAAETGSFSAAARELGQTQPTISRQVAALEATLGVTLFERVGRGLSLTQTGQDLLAQARAMGSAAEAFALNASGKSQDIEGRVCISASDIVAAFYLPDILAKLRTIAPGIVVEVLVSNEISDLKRREADIALRHLRPTQPDLIAKLLGDSDAYIYGAASLIDRIAPLDTAKLAKADFLAYGEPDLMLTYFKPLGLNLTEANFRIICENGLAALRMVEQGLGLGVFSKQMAARTHNLKIASPDLAPIRFPTWLATHRELHTSKRIRLVFDLLSDSLSGDNRI